MADFIPGGQIALIHLIHKNKAGHIKTLGHNGVAGAVAATFDIACTPGSVLPTHASCETVAVTCPLCKATDIFKEIEARQTGNLGGSSADQAVARLTLKQAQDAAAANSDPVPV